MSTTLPVRLSTMRTTYGLRRTIRNSWMSAHCGKNSHMKKSSTLPTHHERGDERETGKWRWGEKENGHADENVRSSVCTSKPNTFTEPKNRSCRAGSSKDQAVYRPKRTKQKKELCSWICQNEQMPEQKGYDAEAFKSKSKKKKLLQSFGTHVMQNKYKRRFRPIAGR